METMEGRYHRRTHQQSIKQIAKLQIMNITTWELFQRKLLWMSKDSTMSIKMESTQELDRFSMLRN
tara:strand:- start:141 stop:338 length:198 start_codon:yes stop_codon:yes gene_type:complete